MLPVAIRKWLAFGTGVGIEIGREDLQVTVARVRPGGVTVLGTHTVEKFRDRPAAEWGSEYAGFLKQHRAGHVSAAVLVPRSEVIVRTLALPGVKQEELAAAVGYQLDALHPYGEDDAVAAWARVDAANVLVGVMRRMLFEQYAAWFSEAGVKVANFTFSAAAIYSAIRIASDPPASFVSAQETGEGWEIYGESPARPVFSAVFEMAQERALAFAAAELRLEPGAEPYALGTGMSHAAAIVSAAPGLALGANLLPEGQRRASSRLRYVPTAVLASALAVLLVMIAMHKPYDEKKYMEALQAEIDRVEPISGRVPGVDKRAAAARGRIAQLDAFRARTREDMDLLLEMTSTLPPPAFLAGMDITRDSMTIVGEADQAAGLLRVLDNSPRLSNSEFTIPIVRVPNGEAFRIRSQRETPPPAKPVPAAAAVKP